jgi:hypothetical protein
MEMLAKQIPTVSSEIVKLTGGIGRESGATRERAGAATGHGHVVAIQSETFRGYCPIARKKHLSALGVFGGTARDTVGAPSS